MEFLNNIEERYLQGLDSYKKKLMLHKTFNVINDIKTYIRPRKIISGGDVYTFSTHLKDSNLIKHGFNMYNPIYSFDLKHKVNSEDKFFFIFRGEILCLIKGNTYTGLNKDYNFCRINDEILFQPMNYPEVIKVYDVSKVNVEVDDWVGSITYSLAVPLSVHQIESEYLTISFIDDEGNYRLIDFTNVDGDLLLVSNVKLKGVLTISSGKIKYNNITLVDTHTVNFVENDFIPQGDGYILSIVNPFNNIVKVDVFDSGEYVIAPYTQTNSEITIYSNYRFDGVVNISPLKIKKGVKVNNTNYLVIKDLFEKTIYGKDWGLSNGLYYHVIPMSEHMCGLEPSVYGYDSYGYSVLPTYSIEEGNIIIYSRAPILMSVKITDDVSTVETDVLSDVTFETEENKFTIYPTIKGRYELDDLITTVTVIPNTCINLYIIGPDDYAYMMPTTQIPTAGYDSEYDYTWYPSDFEFGGSSLTFDRFLNIYRDNDPVAGEYLMLTFNEISPVEVLGEEYFNYCQPERTHLVIGNQIGNKLSFTEPDKTVIHGNHVISIDSGVDSYFMIYAKSLMNYQTTFINNVIYEIERLPFNEVYKLLSLNDKIKDFGKDISTAIDILDGDKIHKGITIPHIDHFNFKYRKFPIELLYGLFLVRHNFNGYEYEMVNGTPYLLVDYIEYSQKFQLFVNGNFIPRINYKTRLSLNNNDYSDMMKTLVIPFRYLDTYFETLDVVGQIVRFNTVYNSFMKCDIMFSNKEELTIGGLTHNIVPLPSVLSGCDNIIVFRNHSLQLEGYDFTKERIDEKDFLCFTNGDFYTRDLVTYVYTKVRDLDSLTMKIEKIEDGMNYIYATPNNFLFQNGKLANKYNEETSTPYDPVIFNGYKTINGDKFHLRIDALEHLREDSLYEVTLFDDEGNYCLLPYNIELDNSVSVYSNVAKKGHLMITNPSSLTEDVMESIFKEEDFIEVSPDQYELRVNYPTVYGLYTAVVVNQNNENVLVNESLNTNYVTIITGAPFNGRVKFFNVNHTYISDKWYFEMDNWIEQDGIYKLIYVTEEYEHFINDTQGKHFTCYLWDENGNKKLISYKVKNGIITVYSEYPFNGILGVVNHNEEDFNISYKRDIDMKDWQLTNSKVYFKKPSDDNYYLMSTGYSYLMDNEFINKFDDGYLFDNNFIDFYFNAYKETTYASKDVKRYHKPVNKVITMNNPLVRNNTNISDALVLSLLRKEFASPDNSTPSIEALTIQTTNDKDIIIK